MKTVDSVPKETHTRVKALFDYQAQMEDEISLKAGEYLLEIKGEDDEGKF